MVGPLADAVACLGGALTGQPWRLADAELGSLVDQARRDLDRLLLVALGEAQQRGPRTLPGRPR